MTYNATIEFTLATPTSVGSHEPFAVDDLWIVRPTSIKGLWRWWARTLIIGILLENENIRCNDKEKFDKFKKKIITYIGKDLGLGYSSDNENLASKFALRIKPIEKPVTKINLVQDQRDPSIKNIYEKIKEKLKNHCKAEICDDADIIIRLRKDKEGNIRPSVNLQRIQLLVAGLRLNNNDDLNEFIKILCSFKQNGRFKLIIKSVQLKDETIFKIGINLLLLALTLGGLGKASRRGLGSIDILDINKQFEDEFNLIRKFELKKFINERIKESLQKSLSIRNIESIKNKELKDFPCISAFSDIKVKIDNDEEYVTEIFKVKNVNFEDLHNFFLQSHRNRKISSNDLIRQGLKGYILGLPRGQESGYKASNINRRASTIILTFHRYYNNNIGIITFIKSGDWPSKIVWKAKGREKTIQKTIQITTEELLRAYKLVKQTLFNYIENRHEQLWP